MGLDDSALLEMIEMLRTADGGDLMRRLLGGMLQVVVDAEATQRIGADRHERTDERTTERNGTRDKRVTTATDTTPTKEIAVTAYSLASESNTRRVTPLPGTRPVFVGRTNCSNALICRESDARKVASFHRK